MFFWKDIQNDFSETSVCQANQNQMDSKSNENKIFRSYSFDVAVEGMDYGTR